MAGSLLVMGGSHFLGRAVVNEALQRGWKVTVFNRGRSGPVPEGVQQVRGDRTETAHLTRLAERGPWNAVVDTSGMMPRVVGQGARALAEVVGHYVFVSSVSVYEGRPLERLTEDSRTLDAPTGADATSAVSARVATRRRTGSRKPGASGRCARFSATAPRCCARE